MFEPLARKICALPKERKKVSVKGVAESEKKGSCYPPRALLLVLNKWKIPPSGCSTCVSLKKFAGTFLLTRKPNGVLIWLSSDEKNPFLCPQRLTMTQEEAIGTLLCVSSKKTLETRALKPFYYSLLQHRWEGMSGNSISFAISLSEIRWDYILTSQSGKILHSLIHCSKAIG